VRLSAQLRAQVADDVLAHLQRDIVKAPFIPRTCACMNSVCSYCAIEAAPERAIVAMVRAPQSFSTEIDGQYVRRLMMVYGHVVLEMSDAAALASAFRHHTSISFESDMQAMLTNSATNAAVDELIDSLHALSLPHADVFVASLREFVRRERARLTAAVPVRDGTRTPGEWCECTHALIERMCATGLRASVSVSVDALTARAHSSFVTPASRVTG
jgi:hypothetical protein